MFEASLPQIPRIITALAQCMSCIIMILFLRKPKNKWLLIVNIGVGAVVLIVANYLFDKYFMNGGNLWRLSVVLSVLLLFLYITSCSKDKMSNRIGCCAIAFVLAEFYATVEWQITNFFSNSDSVLSPIPILIFLILLVLFFGVVYYAERRIYNDTIQLSWKQTWTFVVISVLAFITSNLVFFLFDYKNSDNEIRIVVSLIRTLVDVIAVWTIYLLQVAYHEKLAEKELAAINNVYNLQYQQYLDFKSGSEYINQQCHDLKHQIQALRNACSNEEREDYLKEMEIAIQTYNAQNVTGNSVLDTILTQKKIYCQKNHIQLNCTADGRLLSNLPVRDISVIFGNLLDNAIECVSVYENEGDRLIQGEIYEKNGFLMIKFDNYCNEPVKFVNGFPITTKADKRHHGYGLRGVSYSVKKHNGTMNASCENGWFSVKILLPIQKQIR